MIEPGTRVAPPQADQAQVWDVETGKMKFSMKGAYDYSSSA